MGYVFGILIGSIIGFIIYFLPSFIAYNRNHAYKHIILILNIFGFSGITWVIAMVWAVFPSEKSLIDPVVGNVTGTSSRNSGHTLGEIDNAKNTTIQENNSSSTKSDDVINKIERLAKLVNQGDLSKDEFEAIKKNLLK